MTTECKASSSEEPGAGIPHAGICAGGARQRASLPRYITAYVGESGSIVAEYVYDAYGGTIAQSGSMADVFAHRFSTKYYDTETGLYYYGYRFYSPSLHRWLNRDPIEEEGGENLYAFCMNNPIGFFDQNGLYRMLTGSLTHKKGNARWPGFQYAREIIRFLDKLNRKTDTEGRKCYDAKIADLVLTPLETVREKISKNPDNVYLISHGGLKVNGKIYEPDVYYWNKKDTVVEGLFIRADQTFTPLSSFGESLNPQNIFGCFISPRIRKVRVPNTFFQRYSSNDFYEPMYIALYNRLKRYESVSECPCVTEVIVYEGELGNAEMTTQRALEKYPIKPEQYYTGDDYNEDLANLQNNYK